MKTFGRISNQPETRYGNGKYQNNWGEIPGHGIGKGSEWGFSFFLKGRIVPKAGQLAAAHFLFSFHDQNAPGLAAPLPGHGRPG
jgi:hypothetical protein